MRIEAIILYIGGKVQHNFFGTFFADYPVITPDKYVHPHAFTQLTFSNIQCHTSQD